jgi:hypothetical protein
MDWNAIRCLSPSKKTRSRRTVFERKRKGKLAAAKGVRKRGKVRDFGDDKAGCGEHGADKEPRIVLKHVEGRHLEQNAEQHGGGACGAPKNNSTSTRSVYRDKCKA